MTQNPNIVIIGLTDQMLEPFQLVGFRTHKGNVQDILTREWMGHGSTYSTPTYFVSPANSLGFMDGGIDKAYMGMFNGIQHLVQRTIRDVSPYRSLLGRPFLPIGSAILVQPDQNNYLISAPTMLMPQPVKETHNPYHAMRAIMKIWTGEGTLIVPPLACGYGMIDPKVAAQQMLQAVIDEPRRAPEKCHYIINSEEILSQQPKYYENTEFFEINPGQVVDKPN